MYYYNILAILLHLGMPDEGIQQVGEMISNYQLVAFTTGKLNVLIEQIPGTVQYSIMIL